MAGKFILFLVIGLLYIGLAFVDISEFANSNQNGKYIVFVFITLLVAALIILQLAIYCVKVQIKPVDVFLFVLFIFIIINRYYLQPYQNFSVRFHELCGLAVVYGALRLGNKANLFFLTACLLIGALGQTLYGQFQLLNLVPSKHSLFNITGGFFNPGPYAGFITSAFPLALSVVLHKSLLFALAKLLGKSKSLFSVLIKSIFILSCILLMLSGLVLPATQSRAAWLSVVLSSTYLLNIRYKLFFKFLAYLNSNRKKLFAFLLIGCFSLFCIWALYSFKKSSGDGRILIWKITAQIVGDKPLTGEGFDRFGYAYMNQQAVYFKLHKNKTEALLAGDVSYAFNEFLQFGAENGVPAMLFLLSGFYILLFKKSALKAETSAVIDGFKNMGLRAAKTGIIAIAVFSMFSYPAQILPIKLNLVLYLTIVAFCSKSIITVKESPIKNIKNMAIKVAVCCCFYFVVLFMAFNYWKITLAFKHWETAYDSYTMGIYPQALDNYKKAYPVLHRHGYFLIQYGKALSMAGQHKTAIAILLEGKNYTNNSILQTTLGDSYKALNNWTLAERAYLKAELMTPGRFYPSYLLAKLYKDSHQTDKAKKKAKEVLAKPVKIQSSAVNQIKQEMLAIIDEK